MKMILNFKESTRTQTLRFTHEENKHFLDCQTEISYQLRNGAGENKNFKKNHICLIGYGLAKTTL